MIGRSTRRRYLATIGTTLVGVGLSGCSYGGGRDVTNVDMTDRLTFEPATLAVTPGDTVTWRNLGAVAHSVTAYEDRIPADATYFASGGFDSEAAARAAYPEGRIRGEEAYAHTFEEPGSYAYFCIPHERSEMTGTIEVRRD